MENANQSLELNTYSYNEGKISLIDVLQAQISWIQAYGNKIGAFLNYQLSNAEYNRSIGAYQKVEIK